MTGVVFVIAGTCFLYGLYLGLFRRGRRRLGAAMAAASVIGFVTFFIAGGDHAAIKEGWSDAAEKHEAQAAGFATPEAWQAEIAARDVAKAAVAAEAAAAASQKGFHCLSAWDGTNADLIALVTADLREPDSFEHIETRVTPIDEAGNHTIFMKFRARNGFGGMNVELATATQRNADCALSGLIVE